MTTFECGFCSNICPVFLFLFMCPQTNWQLRLLKMIWKPCVCIFSSLSLRKKTVRLCLDTLKIQRLFLFKLWWLKMLSVVSSRDAFQVDQTLQTLQWLSLITILESRWLSLKGIFSPSLKLSPAYLSVNYHFSATPYQLCFLSPDLQSTISNSAK